jgi:hypothetical protein
MDVLARGFIVVECNAALVVELNENDGAVHTVVKRTSASKAIRRIRHRVR